MDMNQAKTSILEMARGAFTERVDYEMAKIVDNIMDANTIATKKRKLVVAIEFLPDNERSNISVSFEAKSTLVPAAPARTTLYVAGDNSSGEVQIVEMVPQVPGQVGIDGAEQESPAVLKVIKLA